MSLKSINTSHSINSKYFIMKIVSMIALCLFISLWMSSKMITMNKKLILLNNKINLQNKIMQNYIPNKEYNNFKKSIENLYKQKFSTIQTAQKNIHNELANNIARIDQELVNLDYTIDDIKIVISNNDNEKTQLFKKLNDNTVKQSEIEDFAYAVNSMNGPSLREKLYQVYKKHEKTPGSTNIPSYSLRIPKYLYKVLLHNGHSQDGKRQKYIDKLYGKKNSLSPKEIKQREIEMLKS